MGDRGADVCRIVKFGHDTSFLVQSIMFSPTVARFVATFMFSNPSETPLSARSFCRTRNKTAQSTSGSDDQGVLGLRQPGQVRGLQG